MSTVIITIIIIIVNIIAITEDIIKLLCFLALKIIATTAYVNYVLWKRG